jgi:predicted  nucleic acid-binding Zn-ribbon protein
MTDVELARARLDRALARIEQAAAARPASEAASGAAPVAAAEGGSDEAAAALADEVGRLRTENARLAKALKSLETRHAALKEKSTKAVAKLDDTIARVDDLFIR